MPQVKPFNGRTDFFHASLGGTFIKHESEPLIFGLSRAELAKQGCVHITAATRLAKNLASEGIDSIAQLYKTAPQDLVTVPGVGLYQIFVAMCVLDAAGKDIEAWYGWDDETVTTATLARRKAREASKEQTGRRAERKAKRLALA